MNSIEEKLWNYIDGTCTNDEQQAIARLIEQDETYRFKYHELLGFNQEIMALEPDEPSMAFTFNVIEQIRAEQTLKPLKATIDNRIIKGIGAFFLLTILAMLLYIISSVNWSAGSGISLQVPSIKLPELKNIFTGPFLKGFLLFDVMIALVLYDAWRRKRNILKQE